MAEDKRVARDKLSKKQADVFKPLKVLGTQNDPCFGKLYDPKDAICQRCGDCELCAIMMGQKNHIERAKAENKNAFKDLETPPKLELIEAKKLARKRLVELIKKSPNKEVNFIINEVYSIYFTYGITKKSIQRMITGMTEKGKISTVSKNTKTLLQWN